MTLGFPPRNNIEQNLKQAARHMALAVAELRDNGDVEYAVIIQAHLHGLERPHWIESTSAKPVLSAIRPRVYRETHAC